MGWWFNIPTMTSKRHREAIDKARGRRAEVRDLAGQVKKFGMSEMEKHIPAGLMPEVRVRLGLPDGPTLPRRMNDTLGRLLAVAPKRDGVNPEKMLSDMVRSDGQVEPSRFVEDESPNQVVLRKMMTRYGKK